MTRDDIIRMALEVGFAHYGEDAGEYRIPTPAFHDRLERFAALVAAAEREAIVKIIEDNDDADGVCCTDDVLAAIRARGKDESGRCV